MADNTAALQRAADECPIGATIGIPEGRFRFTGHVVVNRAVNFEGHGFASCLWPEQDVYPEPKWVADGYPNLQFGIPYSGFPGKSARNVKGVRLANFSVQGRSDINGKYALGFFSVMHSRIENLVSSASAQRACTAFAACDGTHAEILCDADEGAGELPDRVFLDARPVAISGLRSAGPYQVRDFTFSGTRFPVNGLRRKRYTITGTGASNGRVYANTATVVTLIDQGTAPSGSSRVVIHDGPGGATGEALVVLLDLSARVAHFPGRPASWVPAQDPMNACSFDFLLRGNGGLCGSGVLVETQRGGNNRYSGLFEGFFDTGGRYLRDYGVAKYCLKILTSSAFSIVNAHFEGAGNGKDPNVIIAGSSGNFEIGPSVFVDQKLLIADSRNFRINGGIYTVIERAGSTGNYSISESAYVGKLI